MQPSAQALGRKQEGTQAPKGRKKIKANSSRRPGKPRRLPLRHAKVSVPHVLVHDFRHRCCGFPCFVSRFHLRDLNAVSPFGRKEWTR